MFVIKEIDAWCPQIRSKTAIRGQKKRIFIDQSIAIAALGLSPEYFYTDLDFFGHVFENMVLRDLIVFASVHSANIFHYRDDYGLEIDAIYQEENGDYALIEIKLGISRIEEAEKYFLKFSELIKKYNEKNEVKYKEPNAYVIICANIDYAFTTKNGTKVIPYSCIRP